MLAKDGDIVQEGDVLLILDGTEVKAQLEIIRGQYITLSAQLARLVAERDQKNQISFPENLQDLSDPHIVEARQGESQIFLARKSALQGEISVLKQRIDQLGSKINGLQGQRGSKQELMKSYGEESSRLKRIISRRFCRQTKTARY